MRKKKIPVGLEDFRRCMEEQYYYVDKSMLIQELIDKHDIVNILIRPRRFGKTLNLSMLRCFFENTSEDNRDLFADLSISRCGENYMQHCGAYPVIMLSLKGAKQSTFEVALASICKAIIREFDRHHEAVAAYPAQRNQIEAILSGNPSITDYNDSLFLLSQILHSYYNKRVVLLIDEYDVPLENAFFAGFYEEMLSFIRSLFESALKTNPYLHFAVLTGCLRVSKESIFTGLNNLSIYSICNDTYSAYFGFTETEVAEMLKYYQLDQFDLLKQWYDGYRIGHTDIYNPWSLLKTVKSYIENETVISYPQWANTSSNDIVRHLIERADSQSKAEIETILGGGTIEKIIKEDITYEDIYDSIDSLWNFLYFTGYLTATEVWADSSGVVRAQLKVPNREVQYIFRNQITNWFRDYLGNRPLNDFYHGLLNGETDIIKSEINKVLIQSISYHDYKEDFYHGLMLGMLSGMKDYLVRSNREAGDGRPDIVIRYGNTEGPAMIMEFKLAADVNDLPAKCAEALAQIERNHYDSDLIAEGFKEVKKYGIAFYKKQCLVSSKVSD